MKTKYVKELEKHYLVLRSEEKENEFAEQMLLENKIQGLLSLEKRMFNGEVGYYYDISGKHAIRNSEKQEEQLKLLSGKDIRRMLESLYCLAGCLHSHFLEMKGLLLDLPMIYDDGQEFYFCYDPSSEEDAQEMLVKFAEELPEYIDYDDEEAVELGYRFYKMVKADDKAMLQILEDVLSEEDESYAEKNPTISSQEVPLPAPEEMEMVVEDLQKEETNHFFWRKKPDIVTFLCSVLLLLVSLGYLGEMSYASRGEFFSAICEGKGGVIALAFVVLSIPGMAAGFVDIDIKGKK